MRACCAAGGRSYMRGSPRRLKATFPTSSRGSPNSWPSISPRQGLQQAVAYWRRAGERAVARSSNMEAIAHLTRGIEVLNGLPQSLQRDEQELVFQVALVSPLWACRGFGSSEAKRASKRAVDLCRRGTADAPTHFRALYGLTYAYLLPGDLRSARPLAAQLIELAERVQDPELRAYAHFEMGCELLWPAELAAARKHLEQGIAVYDPHWGRSAASRYAFNCGTRRSAFS